jgi:transposase
MFRKRLTDKQWDKIRAHLPRRKKKAWRRKDRKGGRPPWSARKCFEGILWILRTGAPWADLPERYGKKSTVHLRLSQWAKDGTLEKLWRAFLSQLDEQEKILWTECFVDGTFASAKKGGRASGKPSVGRERN